MAVLPIIPLLFFTALVLFVIFGPRRWRGGRPDAAGTVRDLYARGEISADEMRQRLDTLRAHRK
ncbi:SHOCT domain-containing protein [Luteipulveratus halotolerans]|uniref:SHOCT domain-containing protein n=1 Tax=Luteipulveratus halotolerans TaxID=1631356 RepID=A0A0L6CIP1_9MICO|nr:hypothetical protein [Luteipulveratus halotolerans]KNX37378.1 hypothetical protein VV01_09805 [Luteipulveratus halotolerans]